jgi:hypothetical protein
LYVQLDPATFSVQRFWLANLIGRLFNFLAAAERRIWAERFSPDNEAHVELWTLIDIGLIKTCDETSLQLSMNTALGHVNTALSEEKDYSIHTLTSSLKIMERQVANNSSNSSWGPRLGCSGY